MSKIVSALHHTDLFYFIYLFILQRLHPLGKFNERKMTFEGCVLKDIVTYIDFNKG